MSGFALWLSLRIVEAIAWLVPAAERAEWKREWDAELRHRAAHVRRRQHMRWKANMDLISRALGALPDAAWLRRQFTLDADAVRDAAHGVRMLLKAPGFTAMSLLIFAIGIGAATAIISLADALLVRPLPVAHPERVITVWQYNGETGVGRQDVAPANAIDWVHRARSVEAIAIVEPWTTNMSVPGREPEYLDAARVGEQFFTVLGTSMLHGRPFLPEEYQPKSGRVTILSHSLWRDRFGSDPSIVGRTVRLDNADAFTVVGVMPPRIELRLFNDRATRPEPRFWLPKQGFEPFELNNRGQGYWNVLARLPAGVSLDRVSAEFDALSAQLSQDYPRTNRQVGAHVLPLRAHLAGRLRDVLPLLVGAAAILLMVACANVTNLLVARGAARGREFAVRHALGANRVRLIRQMLVETLLLAAAGGALGLVVARWTLDVVARLRPGDIALIDRVPIDIRAAAIAFGVTVFAAIIAGLTPAVQLSRPASASALSETCATSRRGGRAALLIAQVAAALVLATGAGLLVRSFMLLRSVDPGFSRDDVTALQVFASPRIDTPEKRIVFFADALDRIRALPGVVAAGGVSAMPFGLAKVIARAPVAIAGQPVAAGEESLVDTTAVAGDYFRAMGIPLLEGRYLEPTDTSGSRQVVVVSRNAAQQLWRGRDPLGAKVQFRFSGTAYEAEVVGIVGDVRHEALDRPAAAELFLPYAQSGFRALTLVVRTAPGSPANLQRLKEQIWAIDPLQPIFDTARLDQLVASTLTVPRFNLFLLGGFAAVTLLLASAGVYGVMSFFTSQRTREFGVRMALGAQRRDILRLVVAEGLKLAGVGLAVGFALALPLMRLLRTFLFGVTTTDPATFLVVGAALVIIVVAACYLPANRALKINPSDALRSE
jgi:putative ABC transport system permease protein